MGIETSGGFWGRFQVMIGKLQATWGHTAVTLAKPTRLPVFCNCSGTVLDFDSQLLEFRTRFLTKYSEI